MSRKFPANDGYCPDCGDWIGIAKTAHPSCSKEFNNMKKEVEEYIYGPEEEDDGSDFL